MNILYYFHSCLVLLCLFSLLHTVRCQMAPAVCRKVQWAGPCCHWRIKHLHWAYVQIQVSLVQRCRRMVLSIPALRKYTFTHIQKHAQAHIHPFYLEDEQYLPWWIFFLFVLWMSFFFFFLMTFLAWKPGHMITFLVCVVFFFVFFCTGFRLTRLTVDSGRENGGDVDSVITTLFKKYMHIQPQQ